MGLCVCTYVLFYRMEAYPLPNHEAVKVAEVLMDEFFARFGVGYELHSAQERKFE